MREQDKYQKDRLLGAIVALLLLFTASFSYACTDTVRQTFQSETLYSKNNSSKQKTISYKRAAQFGVFDVKFETSDVILEFSVIHNIQAKVKTIQKHKEYCSFKSNVQFPRKKTFPAQAEDIPIS